MKNKKQIINIILSLCVGGVLLLALVLCIDGGDKENTSKGISQEETKRKSSKGSEEFTVVLDAGHGGVDPGKVGVDGQLEKDINLSIVKKLKDILEVSTEADIEVILTREADMGHYEEDDTNKKMADMKKRCEIVNSSSADMVVSIHQNSYHSSSVKGAQVFYYKSSEGGKSLAGIIQNELVAELAEGNKGRVEKANDNYYLLLNVTCPAVIVECGFLSNPNEANLLTQDSYQERVAQAISKGIITYLRGI